GRVDPLVVPRVVPRALAGGETDEVCDGDGCFVFEELALDRALARVDGGDERASARNDLVYVFEGPLTLERIIGRGLHLQGRLRYGHGCALHLELRGRGGGERGGRLVAGARCVFANGLGRGAIARTERDGNEEDERTNSHGVNLSGIVRRSQRRASARRYFH